MLKGYCLYFIFVYVFRMSSNSPTPEISTIPLSTSLTSSITTTTATTTSTITATTTTATTTTTASTTSTASTASTTASTTSTTTRLVSTAITSAITSPLSKTVPISSTQVITTTNINPIYPSSTVLAYENYTNEFITILIGLLLFFTLIFVGLIILKRMKRNTQNNQIIRYMNNPLAHDSSSHVVNNLNPVGIVDYGYDMSALPTRSDFRSTSETEIDLANISAANSNQPSVSSKKNQFDENFSLNSTGNSKSSHSLNEIKPDERETQAGNGLNEILIDFSDMKSLETESSTDPQPKTNSNPFM